MFELEKFQENYAEVQAEIAHLNLVDDPQLLIVTKYLKAEDMEKLYQAGYRRFGENRPNDLLKKQAQLPYSDIEWHFIGRLQTRPVRKIIDSIDYLHSLDRPSLAEEIQKRRQEPLDCFLQVNVTGEETKTGVQVDQVDQAVDRLAAFDKIRLVGLMTMARHDDTDSQIQETFSRLREAQENVAQQEIPHAPCQSLSMGMSNDYLIAAKEGTSILRLGSRLYQGMSL